MKAITLACILVMVSSVQVSLARRRHLRRERDENLEMLYLDLLMKTHRAYTRYCQSFFSNTDDDTAMAWCDRVSSENYQTVGLNSSSSEDTSVPTEFMEKLKVVQQRTKHLEHIAGSVVTVGVSSAVVEDCVATDTPLCSMACRPERTAQERLFSQLNKFIYTGLIDLTDLISYRYDIPNTEHNYRPISLSAMDQKDVIDKYSLVASSFLYHQLLDIYRLLAGNNVYNMYRL